MTMGDRVMSAGRLLQVDTPQAGSCELLLLLAETREVELARAYAGPAGRGKSREPV
jgi:hypothetical protein